METIDKMERQPTEWEKIFANHIYDKGLISKIHKELIQLKSKTKQKQNKTNKTKNGFKKWAKGLN